VIDSIFIVEPQGYAHHCFEEVALGLHYGAKELGLDWPIHRGPVPHGTSPLILGACLLPNFAGIPKSAVIFNLEQCPGQWFDRPAYCELLMSHEVWDYDAGNIAALRGIGINAKLCRIGYVPQLSRIEKLDEDIDVLFYGSLNLRRIATVMRMGSRYMQIYTGSQTCGERLYGEERDKAIASAKIVLNLHYYPAARFEIVRCSYLLANKKCVVSERGASPEYEQEFADGIAWADYGDLEAKCAELLANPAERERIAQNGFDTFSKMKQSDYLAEALCLQPQPA